MIILGIDPGLSSTGYGVVRVEKGEPHYVACGGIETPSGTQLSWRLAKIYQEVAAIIAERRPGVVAMEQLFFNTNVKSAMAVGEARGAIMLAAEHAGVPAFDYTPLQIKQAVAGYGKADKGQVAFMVRSLLRISDIPSDHASDALATAICHLHHMGLAARLSVVEPALAKKKPKREKANQ
ncbi:MAG: crossover junction endodeoxyribonuclease RuvC [Candidatus Geothermincolia bacterium]